jgi:hypothetical protein
MDRKVNAAKANGSDDFKHSFRPSAKLMKTPVSSYTLNCWRITRATTTRGNAAKTRRYRIHSLPILPRMSTLRVTSIELSQVGSDHICRDRPFEGFLAKKGGGMYGATPCRLTSTLLALTKNLLSWTSVMY